MGRTNGNFRTRYVPFGVIDDGREDETFKDNEGTVWTVEDDEARRLYY